MKVVILRGSELMNLEHWKTFIYEKVHVIKAEHLINIYDFVKD